MSAALALLAGVATWSLLEYFIHRYLGHRYVRNPFGAEHTAHHSRGNYFAPSWKKAIVAAIAWLILWGSARLLVGPSTAAAYAIGFVCFYLTYEAFHRLAHVRPGLTAYGRWMRRHHFHHHFADPRRNHGVTSPIWDFVFGTFDRPKRIRVPRKLAMRWLVDPETGDVRAPYAAWYALK